MSKGWKYWDNDFREWKEVEPDYLDTIFDGEITTNRFDMDKSSLWAPQEVVVLPGNVLKLSSMAFVFCENLA